MKTCKHNLSEVLIWIKDDLSFKKQATKKSIDKLNENWLNFVNQEKGEKKKLIPLKNDCKQWHLHGEWQFDEFRENLEKKIKSRKSLPR